MALLPATLPAVAGFLPPPATLAGLAVTGLQAVAVATQSKAAAETPYSKFAAESNLSVPSRVGMLVIYLPATLTAAWMSQSDAPLVTNLLLLHFVKRVIETLTVHRYSGTLPLPVGVGIGSYYALVVAGISSVATPVPGPEFMALGVTMFILGELGNLYHHILLAQLRKAQAGEKSSYVIPTGGLFDSVTTPHYFFELMAWFGMALAAQQINALLVACTMSSYLGGRAVATSKWYQDRFDDWPAERKHIVPFVF